MTDALILLNRNTPRADGTQTVDVLASHNNDTGIDYYVWTVQSIDSTLTDARVQTVLNGEVAQIIAAILANNEVPLTPDQLSDYQNIIDLQQTQAWLDTLKADIDLINTASPDANALTGYRDAFRTANYTPLTNAQKFALLGAGMFAFAGILSDMIKAERILLKRQLRASQSGNLSLVQKV